LQKLTSSGGPLNIRGRMLPSGWSAQDLAELFHTGCNLEFVKKISS